ncbi:transposase [Candidatus Entotheonella palauensis]|uniref:transposase n=1 Tax=Candidatus Entotheonella palauensis TaxID=93172 RepID=UPI000B7C8237|nr:transposase [Candidatus Entotheonella palauensis]
MPRHARLVLPHYPHHIIQRGHNRQVVFAHDEDYAYYLDTLKVWKTHYGVKVFAFCLMTNHVHLLLDPGASPPALAQLMKQVAARQTRYVNRLEGRTGTLWESRYKSSPVETERYLLACARYIELNPVRANMVARSEDYEWSSYRDKIGDGCRAWLDVDPCYQELGRSATERASRYQAFVMESIPETEWTLIRHAIQRGQLTGSDRFIDEVAAKIGRRIDRRGQGRPKKLPPPEASSISPVIEK